jgi:hypothetical protein
MDNGSIEDRSQNENNLLKKKMIEFTFTLNLNTLPPRAPKSHFSIVPTQESIIRDRKGTFTHSLCRSDIVSTQHNQGIIV